MFPTPLMLPGFFHTTETVNLDQAGVGYPLKECKIRDVSLYSITAVGKYFDETDGDKEYSRVFSGPVSFIIALTMDEVNVRIVKHTINSQKRIWST